MTQEQPKYTIVTIEDAFKKIPYDKIDAFLQDLGIMMKSHKQLENCVSRLAQSEVRLDLRDGFTWIDDGKNDVSLILKNDQ
jgi:hypothetical protein